MVLPVIEPAVSFPRQKTIAVPLMLWFEFRIRAQQIEWCGPVKGGDLYSVPEGFNTHPPIPCMGARMKVAIVDKSLQRQTNRTATSEQRVMDIGCVLALAHPD